MSNEADADPIHPWQHQMPIESVANPTKACVDHLPIKSVRNPLDKYGYMGAAYYRLLNKGTLYAASANGSDEGVSIVAMYDPPLQSPKLEIQAMKSSLMLGPQWMMIIISVG